MASPDPPEPKLHREVTNGSFSNSFVTGATGEKELDGVMSPFYGFVETERTDGYPQADVTVAVERARTEVFGEVYWFHLHSDVLRRQSPVIAGLLIEDKEDTKEVPHDEEKTILLDSISPPAFRFVVAYLYQSFIPSRLTPPGLIGSIYKTARTLGIGGLADAMLELLLSDGYEYDPSCANAMERLTDIILVCDGGVDWNNRAHMQLVEKYDRVAQVAAELREQEMAITKGTEPGVDENDVSAEGIYGDWDQDSESLNKYRYQGSGAMSDVWQRGESGSHTSAAIREDDASELQDCIGRSVTRQTPEPSSETNEPQGLDSVVGYATDAVRQEVQPQGPLTQEPSPSPPKQPPSLSRKTQKRKASAEEVAYLAPRKRMKNGDVAPAAESIRISGSVVTADDPANATVQRSQPIFVQLQPSPQLTVLPSSILPSHLSLPVSFLPSPPLPLPARSPSLPRQPVPPPSSPLSSAISVRTPSPLPPAPRPRSRLRPGDLINPSEINRSVRYRGRAQQGPKAQPVKTVHKTKINTKIQRRKEQAAAARRSKRDGNKRMIAEEQEAEAMRKRLKLQAQKEARNAYNTARLYI